MIELKKISKEYLTENGFKKAVLKNITCQIPKEKITALVAAKKSGLTTLCKIACGLEESTSGEVKIELGDKIIYVPSEPSSFPWRNVFDNVRFGPKSSDKDEILRLIKIVGLEGYEKFRPHKDSFGFRFRISLARSLAHKPTLIVVDDSFQLMNHQTKNEIYSLLKEINKTEHVGFVIATSNVTEALLLANKIFLLKNQPTELSAHFDTRQFDISEIDSAEFISWRIQIENEFKKNISQSLSCISI